MQTLLVCDELHDDVKEIARLLRQGSKVYLFPGPCPWSALLTILFTLLVKSNLFWFATFVFSISEFL